MTDLGCALRADSLAAAQGDEQPAAVAAVQDGAPYLRGPLEPRRGQGPYRARIPHRGAEDHQEGALLWGTYLYHVVLMLYVFKGKPIMDGRSRRPGSSGPSTALWTMDSQFIVPNLSVSGLWDPSNSCSSGQGCAS